MGCTTIQNKKTKFKKWSGWLVVIAFHKEHLEYN